MEENIIISGFNAAAPRARKIAIIIGLVCNVFWILGAFVGLISGLFLQFLLCAIITLICLAPFYIVGTIIYKRQHCYVAVTGTRVYGDLMRGESLDLLLTQIDNVAYSDKDIVLTSTYGTRYFLRVDNQEEMAETINELLKDAKAHAPAEPEKPQRTRTHRGYTKQDIQDLL